MNPSAKNSDVLFPLCNLIATHFIRLENVTLRATSYCDSQGEVEIAIEHSNSLISALDNLFDPVSCAFAKTVKSLNMHIPCFNIFNKINQDDSMFHIFFRDHVMKHWQFQFPQLEEFSLHLHVNHPLVTGVMLGRILANCPKLKTIKLYLVRHSGCIRIIDRPNLICEMKEQYQFR